MSSNIRVEKFRSITQRVVVTLLAIGVLAAMGWCYVLRKELRQEVAQTEKSSAPGNAQVYSGQGGPGSLFEGVNKINVSGMDMSWEIVGDDQLETRWEKKVNNFKQKDKWKRIQPEAEQKEALAERGINKVAVFQDGKKTRFVSVLPFGSNKNMLLSSNMDADKYKKEWLQNPLKAGVDAPGKDLSPDGLRPPDSVRVFSLTFPNKEAGMVTYQLEDADSIQNGMIDFDNKLNKAGWRDKSILGDSLENGRLGWYNRVNTAENCWVWTSNPPIDNKCYVTVLYYGKREQE